MPNQQAIQQAMQEEIQASGQGQRNQPGKLNRRQRRILQQALRLIDPQRFPTLAQALRGPQGPQIAQQMVGKNGNDFAKMDMQLSGTTVQGAQEFLQGGQYQNLNAAVGGREGELWAQRMKGKNGEGLAELDRAAGVEDRNRFFPRARRPQGAQLEERMPVQIRDDILE